MGHKKDKVPKVSANTMDRLNGMNGVQEWSKKRTTSEQIPSTVSKEAAAIIQKILDREAARKAAKG
jgi:hypothetical protein